MASLLQTENSDHKHHSFIHHSFSKYLLMIYYVPGLCWNWRYCCEWNIYVSYKHFTSSLWENTSIKLFWKWTQCSEKKVKVPMKLKSGGSNMAWEIHFDRYVVIQFGQNYNNLNIVLIGLISACLKYNCFHIQLFLLYFPYILIIKSKEISKKKITSG